MTRSDGLPRFSVIRRCGHGKKALIEVKAPKGRVAATGNAKEWFAWQFGFLGIGCYLAGRVIFCVPHACLSRVLQACFGRDFAEGCMHVGKCDALVRICNTAILICRHAWKPSVVVTRIDLLLTGLCLVKADRSRHSDSSPFPASSTETGDGPERSKNHPRKTVRYSPLNPKRRGAG